TLRSTSLRALPTHRPFFNDPREAGEGFPFDNLQHSTLAANVPLHVLHLSRDGNWAFVETTLVYGWMPIQDLAWVDDQFVGNFQQGDFLAFTKDDIPVFDTNGRFRFLTSVGMLLPVRGSQSGQHRVLLAAAGIDRQAVLREGTAPLHGGETFPVILSPQNMAALAEGMMGQLYGWGGSFGGRDCSATVRDLFAPFGLWLPRNSSRQAQVGEVIPLADLPPRQRASRILQQGVPWLTLVRLPGHIMLYIGQYGERAALLHTLWGLRTRTLFGEEGRWIAGRTVITTLEPGQERKGMGFAVSRLLANVESMNILLPVASSGGTIESNASTAD
ncbi:MAG TPA: SH3 domain-containing protein, partial [Desulfuromonadales bacterium]|nr:SH3 domain-containing protein [Desulfuromonadales bacterium]